MSWWTRVQKGRRELAPTKESAAPAPSATTSSKCQDDGPPDGPPDGPNAAPCRFAAPLGQTATTPPKLRSRRSKRPPTTAAAARVGGYRPGLGGQPALGAGGAAPGGAFLHWVAESVKLAIGCALLLGAGPAVVVQVALCTAWEALDKRSLDLLGWASRLARAVDPLARRFVKHPETDGFVACVFVWTGVVLPAWFFYELWHARVFGFSWPRVVLYNLVRIGPMYANFMYVYVLCHKEGHNFGNLFAKPYNKVLRYAFNHWVGMFHGVLPGTFTYSHIYNHHKYDNDERDVYSTAFRPRDRFGSWVRYLPEWFAYASNVSSVRAFVREGRTRFALATALSTLGYAAFVAALLYAHTQFALCTVVYAFVEGNILLSVVNYTWHAFIEPTEPSNDYVNSTTIVEGLNFTLGEEYHVVHHQYAGAHWTRHRALFEKHLPRYRACVATGFFKVNIFEVFGLIVGRQYAQLAKLYYKPFRADVTDEELVALIKRRLRCHGPDIAKQVGSTHRAGGRVPDDGSS
jgi:hypothetical protein